MTKILATLARCALSLTGADLTGQSCTAELTYDTALGTRASDPALFASLIGRLGALGAVPRRIPRRSGSEVRAA